MTKYEEAIKLIEKTADEWDKYFAYGIAKDNGLELKCPNVLTYDQLLNKILDIYGIHKNI